MRYPKHIGIIPDGNRRFATKNGLEKHLGYNSGITPAINALHIAQKIGVEEITFYGFTSDNCKRPKTELEAFSRACVDSVMALCNEKISLLVVGNDESPLFPKELKLYTKRQNINGGGIRVNILVNYGWEWDICKIDSNNNRKKIMYDIKSRDISRIDLVIRWGGMRRLSGFLPIQCVYSDFFVVDDLWPDFIEQHLLDALQWYNHQDVTLGG